MTVLILGCGFTGIRVAKRMLARGARVIAASRTPERLQGLGVSGRSVEAVRLEDVPKIIERGCLVTHSLPPEANIDVIDLLGDLPARVVYLSTTGVYGSKKIVDESTLPDGTQERARLRIAAESAVLGGGGATLILRAAAIYGPGRGVHVAVREGRYPLTDNFISRIHVDDLAEHVEAGLMSDVTGAYPVADDEPCTSREIAEFCAKLQGVELPQGPIEAPRVFGDRKVDGRAIRRVLGIELRYPSYRTGIPAAILGE